MSCSTSNSWWKRIENGVGVSSCCKANSKEVVGRICEKRMAEDRGIGKSEYELGEENMEEIGLGQRGGRWQHYWHVGSV